MVVLDRVDTLYISYFIEYNGDDEPHGVKHSIYVANSVACR
jgi:hypothetical protein